MENWEKFGLYFTLVLFGLVCLLCLFVVGLYLYALFKYANTPMSELPFWVIILLE